MKITYVWRIMCENGNQTKMDGGTSSNFIHRDYRLHCENCALEILVRLTSFMHSKKKYGHSKNNNNWNKHKVSLGIWMAFNTWLNLKSGVMACYITWSTVLTSVCDQSLQMTEVCSRQWSVISSHIITLLWSCLLL